jgi:hypothetical protein
MLTIDHCSWDAPGTDPFRGDVPAAVARYSEIPAPTRLVLRQKMQRHEFDDVAEIRRDTIAGKHQYADLRRMHFGNKLCGKVSRAKWTDSSVERGLVYCAGEHCVIVPTVCNNVSLITRLPPKDVPRAAPPQAPVLPPETSLLEPPAEPPVIPIMPAEPPASPPTFEERSAPPPPWVPPTYVFVPTPVPVPFVPPPVHAIPEPATWASLLAGLACFVAIAFARRRRH